MKSILIIPAVFALFISAWGSDYKIKEDFEWVGGETAKSLEIENANGNIVVKTGVDTIAVKAVKNANSEEYLEGIEIKVEEKGNNVIISVDYPDYELFVEEAYKGGGSVNFGIAMPSDVSLDVDIANGDVTTEGVSALEIELANGDANVNGAYERAIIDLANGTIDIDNPGGKTTKTIDANVANGDIEAAFILPESGGDFVFNAINGEVTINLEGDNFDFEGSTVTGKILADFPLKSDKGWVGGDYWAKVGDGGNKIVADVVSGTVEVNTEK
ncbi:MAG: DUF4097 family beta strand repeat protein [bacterium]|nr:DUF4097 family beta strand repeat protein [bacterium]